MVGLLLTTLGLAALQTDVATASPDSVTLHRAMLTAQRNFEYARRRLLPISTAGTGRCDEQVGRFCYWYDPEEPPPPDEPLSIKEKRAEFLAELAHAATVIPGDSWILAQRVRYLVEHGVPDSAIALAHSCPGWWCEALAGFALHVKGDVASAESSFAAALTHMPRTERCSWNNLSPILEPRDRERYQGLDCDGRDSANAGLFWRATPLFARPGNDARTEWYSRQIWIRALDNAITHHGMRLGGDFREMLLRYGWATAYGRRPDSYRPVEDIDVVGHEPKPAYPFLALDPQGNWPPASERPKARFAPVFARYITGLSDVQLARFRRGDSLVVVTGFVARKDSLFHDDPTAVLVLTPWPGELAAQVFERTANGAGSTSAAAAGATHVASLEVEDADHRAWAVLRTDPLERPELISDLLFTDRGDQLPENLAHAISIARSGSRVREGSIIGLYWETYGHEPSDSTLAISLTVEPVRSGFLGRVGQSLGLKRQTPPLKLAWTRGLDASAPVAVHAVELNLSRLTPGSYVLQVEMGDKRQATRAFEIVRSDRITASVRIVPPFGPATAARHSGLSAVAFPPQPRAGTSLGASQ